MEEFLQNICLLKDFRNGKLSQNIEIEGQRNFDEILKKNQTSCFYFWSF